MKKLATLLLAILLTLSLVACSKTGVDSPLNEQESNRPSATATASEPEYDEENLEKNVEETTVPVDETDAPTQDETSDHASKGIRPEIKKIIDDYEAFYTEYCSFMKGYSENPTDPALLIKSAELDRKAEEVGKAFDAVDAADLSNEEWIYYLSAYNRIMEMLADISD